MVNNIYQISDLDEYKIHSNVVNQLTNWILNWSREKKRKYIILTGPSGSGKSLLVNLLFKKYKYSLVEFIPSHLNTHKNETKRLYQLMTATNILSMIGGHKKGVLFDDIEVGNNSDRGYLNDIISMFETIHKNNVISNPAIFTMACNVKYKKRQILEKYADIIELPSPSNYELFQIARYITDKMDLSIEDYRLQYLANNCQADLRKLYHGFSFNSNISNPTSKKIIDKYHGDIKFKPKISKNKGLDPPENQDPDQKQEYNQYQEIIKRPPTVNSDSDNNNNDNDNDLMDILAQNENTMDISRHDSWKLLGKKDLEYNPLTSIEANLDPNYPVNIEVYQKIFESEPIFTPANIYDNSWQLLNKINYKHPEERYQTYERILNSICDWASLENYYSDPASYSGCEFKACLGVAVPMSIIRNERKKHKYDNIQLKTSNLFSRISQSSFNWKSISELSERLNINRNLYHHFSYVMAKLISNPIISLEKLSKYLLKQNINPGDLDRIIRYNCISKVLEKQVVTKRKTVVRKILNGKHKNKEKASNKTKSTV